MNAAIARRKLLPAQREWAEKSAADDPEGFGAFVEATSGDLLAVAVEPVLVLRELQRAARDLPASDKRQLKRQRAGAKWLGFPPFPTPVQQKHTLLRFVHEAVLFFGVEQTEQRLAELQQAAATVRGKPGPDSAMEKREKAEWDRQYIEAYNAVGADDADGRGDPDRIGRKPKDSELALKMSMSVRTLQRHVKEYGWPQ